MFNKYKYRHKIWFKAYAIGTVCLFLVNTIVWAYPPTHVPPAKSTLAVWSIFKPILDVTGAKYASRIHAEMSFIISMALKGLRKGDTDYRSWLNINTTLDKMCNDKKRGFDMRSRKLLEVLSNPILRDDGIVELHVRTTQYRKQREFTIVFRGNKVEDMFDRSKIEVVSTPVPAEEKPPLTPAEKARKAKQIFGENIVKDELDFDYDFQQFMEEHRRKRFEEGNEGSSKGVLEWLPLKIVLIPLYKCVASCLHCFFRDSVRRKDQMSIADMARVFDTREFHIKNPPTHLSGGEILLRDDLIEMVEKFPIFSLATNASTMTSLEKAEGFIKTLKKAFEKRITSVRMGVIRPDKKEKSTFDRYRRFWLDRAWMMEGLIEVMELTCEDTFHIYISLDDIHLAEPAISVEKIANLIAAAVKHYPEMGLAFISLRNKWEKSAYPALREALKKHNLTLEFDVEKNKIVLTGKDGLEKRIGLQENPAERIGGAFNNLSDEDFTSASLPKGKGFFGYYNDFYGIAMLDYRGNMSISDGFLAEHSPLVFGNILEEGWGKILRRVDKDPLFRALILSTREILSIAEEYDPDIVKNIQDGKSGSAMSLFYWLLSNPERKLYVTYRLLRDYYEEGVLKGENPFKGIEPHEIKALVEKEVSELREKFKQKQDKATKPAPAPEEKKEPAAYERLNNLLQFEIRPWQARKARKTSGETILDDCDRRYNFYDIGKEEDIKAEDFRILQDEKSDRIHIIVGADQFTITDDLQTDLVYAAGCEYCMGCAFRGRKATDGAYVHGVFHILPAVLEIEKDRKRALKYIAEKIKDYGVNAIECAFVVPGEKKEDADASEFEDVTIDTVYSVFENEGITILKHRKLRSSEESSVYLTSDGTIMGLDSPEGDSAIIKPEIHLWSDIKPEPTPAPAEERPALEPHQRYMTNEVKRTLKRRLKNSPIIDHIFDFLRIYNIAFVHGMPKKQIDNASKKCPTGPASCRMEFKGGKTDIVKEPTWIAVYMDFDDFEENYLAIIHELVEAMIVVNLLQQVHLTGESLKKPICNLYTDTMVRIVMHYHAEALALKPDEVLKISHEFIRISLLATVESKTIMPLLGDSIFAQELHNYFNIIWAYITAIDGLAKKRLFNVTEKFDSRKERWGLSKEEKHEALQFSNCFFYMVDKTLAETEQIEKIFPTLTVFAPSFDAISPEEIEIPELHNFLNCASKYIKDYPVDMTIDLSLIPKADMDANMKTWAYLMLLHNKYSLDIHYVFKSEDENCKQEAENVLLGHIKNLRGPEKAEGVKRRLKPHADPKTIEIRIMKLEDLEKMRTLPDNVLPVAMSEGDMQYGVPIRDFASATNIGLAQAACKKLKMENNPDLSEVVEREILPRLQKIYKRLFPNENIKDIVTKDTILNMIDENPIVRKNLAIALALPPIVRVAIQYLKDYHDRLHLLLQHA